ncbi:hypothetical protein IJH66_02630 [Candidatus Saccharibacteria bacterium]|nr:hypothetical protein [Candidatus Saccharibacteria bacterium]
MRSMSSLGIVVFSALICALLQLSLGTLLLLYHNSIGRHIRKKTKSLAGSFISGVFLMNFLLLATNCFLSYAFFGGELPLLAFSVLIGILAALSLVIFCFYFRRGKTSKESTELWLPKSISRFVDSRAKITNNNSEAFALGLLTVFGELPFTFALFFLSGSMILELNPGFETLALCLFSLISVLPLLVLRLSVRRGKTVVEVQRFRVRNKFFFKLLAGICFLSLAGFVFAFKILQGGV